MGSVVSEYVQSRELTLSQATNRVAGYAGNDQKTSNYGMVASWPLGTEDSVRSTVAFVDRTPDIIACANLRRGRVGCQLCMIPSPTRLGPF